MSIGTSQPEPSVQPTGPTPSWRLAVISLLFLAGSIASGLVAWNASRQPDVLLIPDPVHAKLGAVPRNTDVPIEFVLANRGREWIEIMSVESSCSCMAAEMETYRIPPDSSVKLKATLSTGNREGSFSTLIGLVFRGRGRSQTFRTSLTISAVVQSP